MLATNHGLTGIIIGATQPIGLAIPMAIASHFVLDMIPHYGISGRKRNKSRTYKTVVYTDTVVALSLAFYAAYIGRWDMFWVGWIAYGPDAYWVYLYFKQNMSLNIKKKSRFSKFHQKIQNEYPWGLIVELPFAAVLFYLFISLL